MLLPSLKQIVELHNLSLERFGGELGVLDRDGLMSFPDQMQQVLYFGMKDVVGVAT